MPLDPEATALDVRFSSHPRVPCLGFETWPLSPGHVTSTLLDCGRQHLKIRQTSQVPALSVPLLRRTGVSMPLLWANSYFKPNPDREPPERETNSSPKIKPNSEAPPPLQGET